MDQSPGFKITRRALDGLGPDVRSIRGMWHSDRELKGFYLLAYPRQLSFFVRYRVDGQRRTVKLGDYPAVSPEDARRAALAVLGGAARGEDEAARGGQRGTRGGIRKCPANLVREVAGGVREGFGTAPQVDAGPRAVHGDGRGPMGSPSAR